MYCQGVYSLVINFITLWGFVDAVDVAKRGCNSIRLGVLYPDPPVHS